MSARGEGLVFAAGLIMRTIRVGEVDVPVEILDSETLVVTRHGPDEWIEEPMLCEEG